MLLDRYSSHVNHVLMLYTGYIACLRIYFYVLYQYIISEQYQLDLSCCVHMFFFLVLLKSLRKCSTLNFFRLARSWSPSRRLCAVVRNFTPKKGEPQQYLEVSLPCDISYSI